MWKEFAAEASCAFLTACVASCLFLAIVIDLYSRRVVGWELTDYMRSDLIV
jgi:transposase InsO family protein